MVAITGNNARLRAYHRRVAQISYFSQILPMKILTATDAKNRFGELIYMARAEPVRVQRQGRDVAVVP
jgi:hypothetical protein